MIAIVETGLHWREPWWMALSLLVVIVVGVRYRQRVRVVCATANVDGSVSHRVSNSWRLRLWWMPSMMQSFAMLALLVALARPVVVESEPPARLGREILLCFDRSSSMAALDLDPTKNRLAVGKELAADFLRGRRDDRLGIVSFARFADLVCPPTRDHAAVTELLGGVQLVDSDGSEDATAIGAAVGMAANLLQRSAAPGKVIVLLTDGEENVATAGATEQIAPLHAGQWCRDHDIRVHCIALGRGEQGADGSWRALDTTAVQQLAQITGGRFYPAADAATLQAVYAEIDQLEAVRFAEPGVRVDEWFALPTWIGLLLFAGAHLLRHSRMAVMP